MNMLDTPVWASLTSQQADLSRGGKKARRYRPSVNVFAATEDNSTEALDALTELLGSGEVVFLLQATSIICPQGLIQTKTGEGVQMVWAGDATNLKAKGVDAIPLGNKDAADMLGLAKLTEPGPFREETYLMGDYYGIRSGGKLIAMAGERMRFDGHTELSGVCVHPDFEGKGLGGALSALVTSRILDRGETPFLHAWRDNDRAITLYERLGYRFRTGVNVAILKRL